MSTALLLLVALGQVPGSGPARTPLRSCASSGHRGLPTARQPPRLERTGTPPCRPCGRPESRATWKSRRGLESASQDRDGPADPAHVCAARFRRAATLGSRRVAQPPNRIQNRAVSAEPPAVEKPALTFTHAAQSLSFWKAIDELCDAASLQYNRSMQGFAGHAGPGFRAHRGGGPHPHADFGSGPFRVRLLGIDYQRRLSYAPAADDGTAVPALPRPGRPVGQPRVAAWAKPAESGHDRAIHAPSSGRRRAAAFAGPSRRASARRSCSTTTAIRWSRLAVAVAVADLPRLFGNPHGPVMETHIQLHRPADPGETIKKLRGTIPGQVSSRGPRTL